MRIISRNTLVDFWKKHPNSGQPLKSWYDEVKKVSWKNHGELKRQFASASVITNKRVVFNIKGNDYRLVVDIEFSIQLIFIVWFGTHNEYDKINVKTISYVKSN